MAVRPIDGEALLKELTCNFAGDAFHGNRKVTIGEVRRIIKSMPTLTPPNEWVSRMREIEELHAKLRAVTGCSLEQIIEMFAAGYTLEKPDYSNETMDRLDETTTPNEWAQVLEAINNEAVAYIEGGPYKNDLPGMELALKIDRLSRDFVRPPEGEEDA